MKLYIKQKVFTLAEKFAIKDGLGYDKYFVEAKFMSIPKQFLIYDTDGNTVATIEKKFFSIPQKYTVEINEVAVAQIIKNITLFKPSFSVSGPNWEIKGDIFAHDYTFYNGETVIAKISKEWISWGDSYAIDYANPNDEILTLACVIAIDESISDSNNSYNT